MGSDTSGHSLRSKIWRHRVKDVLQSELESQEGVKKVALSYLENCEPQLQNGPQCGLVAVQMGLSALGTAPVTTAAELYDQAKQLGFTVNGEMYSAPNMARLCNLQSGVTAAVTTVPENPAEMKRLLVDGPLLIPYDNDKNFQPCLKRGHSAHWAVLVGFLLITDEEITDLNSTGIYSKDEEIDCLYHCSDFNTKVNTSNESLFVYALHGKSRHVAVWSYRQLLESNRNLIEFGDERASDGRTYVLPEGGVEAGLKGLAVTLKPT